MKQLFISMAIIATSVNAYENLLLPSLVENGSIKQFSFNGGGSALPDNANGIALNTPSLFAYHKAHGKRVGIAGSYLNNKDGRIASGGAASYALNPKTVVAGAYQFRDDRTNTNAPHTHKGTIGYSGLIQEDKSGSIFSYGISVSYLNKTGTFDLPESITQSIGEDSSYSYNNPISSMDGSHQIASLDLGFLEYDALSGLSYTLVLENLVGYSRVSRSHSLKTVPTNDTLQVDDTTFIRKDSSYYSNTEDVSSDWLTGQSKSLLIGLAVQRALGNNTMLLSIPFDVRFWGLFDKDLRHNSKWKDRCMLRTGAELNFTGKLSLRMGYSWAPDEYRTSQSGRPLFNNSHHISGGFGLTLGVLDLGMGFRENEFAAEGALYF